MDTYSLIREIADSWVLLAMFCFFVGAGIWAFLPSQHAAREDARMIPLRNQSEILTRTDTNVDCADDDTAAEGDSYV